LYALLPKAGGLAFSTVRHEGNIAHLFHFLRIANLEYMTDCFSLAKEYHRSLPERIRDYLAKSVASPTR
jgi:hypothetical protein